MADVQVRDLLESILLPVVDPGNPLRDPRFTEIKKEVSNAASAHAGEVNWGRVAELSCGVLRETGKDLTLTAYLVYVMFRSSGLPGLCDGFEATAQILRGGGIVSPTRPVYQKRALQWLLKKVDPTFRSLHEHGVEPDLGNRLMSSIRALDTACSERLGDQDPGLGRHRKAVREHLERLKLERAEPHLSEKSLETVSVPVPAPKALVEEKSLDNEEKSLDNTDKGKASRPVEEAPVPTEIDEQCNEPGPPRKIVESRSTVETPSLSSLRKQMARHAAHFREENLGDPVSYRLMRSACWLEVGGPPKAQENGRTAVGGIPASTWKRLESLREKARWAGILQQCENLILTRPYHLDLQRFSGEALAGMGHRDALISLTTELRGFLARVPGLQQMSDKTGRPLADAATKAWIRKHARLMSESKPVLVSSSESSNRDLEEVDSTPEGLQKFQQQVRGTHSEREGFILRLRLGESMNRRGEYGLSLKLFYALVGDEVVIPLCRWDPDLYARGLVGLAHAQLATGGSAENTLGKLVVADASLAAALLRESSNTR